jgi:hypothetical protein
MTPHLIPYQVGQAAEHLVAAEIYRRGGFAALFVGNRPTADLLASSPDQKRTVSIQVKTKTSGTWQTTILKGKRTKSDPSPTRFWVLVDIGRDPAGAPSYWVVPESWMLNHIYERTRRLKLDQRPSGTKHFAIKLPAVEQWRDRWDLLGIFPDADLSQGARGESSLAAR